MAVARLTCSSIENSAEYSGTYVLLRTMLNHISSGLTCARRIRQLEEDGDIVKHVPIIAVTANARSEQIETAIAAGMDDVVSKPFRIPELMPKIEELMEKFKAIEERACSPIIMDS